MHLKCVAYRALMTCALAVDFCEGICMIATIASKARITPAAKIPNLDLVNNFFPFP